LKRFAPLFAALGSGLLLWAAWPVSPFTFLVFIAWVPLLWMETQVKSNAKFFWLCYLTMFVWNTGTTWWIWNASAPGALGAFFVNSLLMCFPWLGYRIVKKWRGEKIGYLSLVAFWMCFEYIHLQDWGLSWPWLTLGNSFASHPEWIRWYRVTGTSGGTLWILVINLLLFFHLKNNLYRTTSKSYKYLVIAILILATPIAISKILNFNFRKGSNVQQVLVVQPNIDPYQKVSEGTFETQLQRLIQLSEEHVTEETDLVIWPETALYMGSGIEETRMKENHYLKPLWAFLERHPSLSLFTGVESYRVYPTRETKTAKPAGEGFYYDSFNGSVLLDSSGSRGFYHKSMLVPGVETLPWFLRFIDTWFEKFGGTTAGYARQNERTVLTDGRHSFRIAPAICYESVYGEFMAKYIRNGANLICIITNDGWWGKTPGHRQHMSYARLRALETGQWIARSANTGISCFIDPSGRIIDPQAYDTAAAISLSIDLPRNEQRDNHTFFVRHGDILSKIAAGISVALVMLTTVTVVRKKIRNRI
jgi:apolipoprotein N-acyltransferase